MSETQYDPGTDAKCLSLIRAVVVFKRLFEAKLLELAEYTCERDGITLREEIGKRAEQIRRLTPGEEAP